jgi:hypothetical protein
MHDAAITNCGRKRMAAFEFVDTLSAAAAEYELPAAAA